MLIDREWFAIHTTSQRVRRRRRGRRRKDRGRKKQNKNKQTKTKKKTRECLLRQFHVDPQKDLTKVGRSLSLMLGYKKQNSVVH